MPTKSLEDQLRDLEDVEARLRPLVQEGRGMVQDLKAVVKEAKAAARTMAEEALKAEMGRLIEREMRDVVPDIAKFKVKLRQELEELVGPIADLLEQVSTQYSAVSAHYDTLAKELQDHGYEHDGTRRLLIPVPNQHGEREHLRHRRPR